MNQDTHTEPKIVPGASWGDVRLGSTMDEVQKALDRMGITNVDREEDDHVWVTDNPYFAFYFEAGETPRLAQILIGDFPATIYGSEIMCLRIDEALRILQVRSFSDTLWSGVEVDEEFDKGIPIADEDRVTNYTTMEKLRYGLLWIKSLGIGLGMNDGHVGEVVLRLPESTPTIGCGPLSESDLLEVTSDTFQETIASHNAQLKEEWAKMSGERSLFHYVRAILQKWFGRSATE